MRQTEPAYQLPVAKRSTATRQDDVMRDATSMENAGVSATRGRITLLRLFSAAGLALAARAMALPVAATTPSAATATTADIAGTLALPLPTLAALLRSRPANTVAWCQLDFDFNQLVPLFVAALAIRNR